MKLFSKQYSGQGEPLVILHGLYGNTANWTWHARQLAAHHAVYAFDARNHGQSGWAPSMTLEEMAADVAETMDSLGLANAHLLGHSMGGKTAMVLALRQPTRVRSLIAVDIAPVVYPEAFDNVLEALLGVELAGLTSRADADAGLSTRLKDKAVRDFLLTNLQRNADGSFQWRINLPVIAQYFDDVRGWPLQGLRYEGPALFIRGEQSSYMLPEHRADTLAQFPAAELITIEGAGHWVHAEKPEAVLRQVRKFLDVEQVD